MYTWISGLFIKLSAIFHCLHINYKEMRYLADPKIPYLNSLGRDLIYHLWFFMNWYANFLIFPFDWYFFVMSISVFLLANMNFRRRSICLLKYVPRDIAECLVSVPGLLPLVLNSRRSNCSIKALLGTDVELLATHMKLFLFG